MGKIFNPRAFSRPKEKLSVVPRHGESWTRKWANWWAGATIASPTQPMVAPAAWALGVIRELYDSPADLNEFFVQRGEWAREMVREVLALPASTPVILDASGTSAILTATRMLAHVSLTSGKKEMLCITTNEGGSLVPATLRGSDPNEIVKVMFQPGTMLFYEPSPVLPYPPEHLLAPSFHSINVQDFDNEEFVEELRRVIEGNKDASIMIMLPHVVKTGRILPVREVGELVKELKAAGRVVYYVIDDVQGIGRCHAESVANPTAFADAYLFGASKALGGLLIASAVAIREEHMREFAMLLSYAVASGNGAPFASTRWLSHFQLAPEWEELMPECVFKDGALSMPEVVSMSAALQHFYTRGEGVTFADRRRHQLELVASRRAELAAALKTIDGISVMEPSAGKPLVPSIVSFRLERSGSDWLSPAALKRMLQEGNPIITPTAPIGRWLRLDIPEYRDMPSVDVLVDRLHKIIGE